MLSGLFSDSWIQRTSQLTEFAVLKDSVKKLERSSREQLLLENETQGAFDHLSGEVASLKEAVGALSRVVDGELATLRSELQSMRAEVRGAVSAARKEAESAAQSASDSQNASGAVVTLGVTQLKEGLGRLEEQLHEARKEHLGLATEHAASAAQQQAATEGVRTEARAAVSALEKRHEASDERGSLIKNELDQTLRHEHNELLAWSVTARAQLDGLRKDADETAAMASDNKQRAITVGAVAAANTAGVEKLSSEAHKHGESLNEMISTIISERRAGRERTEDLAKRLEGAEAGLVERSKVHDAAVRKQEAEAAKQREAIAALDGRATKQQEEATATRNAVGRHTDRLKNLESDGTATRRDGSELTATLRQLKSGMKEVTDGLGAYKRDTRRQLNALDVRCEAYDTAIGSFAEKLNMPNPVAAGLDWAHSSLESAAAAL